jgi:hypothetical protein
LTVSITRDEHPQPEFCLSMALLSDDVRIGLLPEYAVAVAAAVDIETSLLAELGPGQLNFHCGAHGMYGSAWAVFQALTSAVIALLLRGHPPSDSELASLLRERLFGREWSAPVAGL